MRRGDFLVLAWAPDDLDAVRRVQGLAARLEAEGGWRTAGALPGLMAWTSAAGRMAVAELPHAAGLVLGDVFPMPDAPIGASPLRGGRASGDGPLPVARALSRSHWGAYVALLTGGRGEPSGLYADPSGDLEAQAWALGEGLEAVASDVLKLPSWLRPPRVALNWDRISGLLAAPGASRFDSLLDGVRALRPGDLSWLASDRPPVTVWRAVDFLSAGGPDPREAAASLVGRVQAATAALMSGHEQLLLELSGGLDSAIVAGTVGALEATGRIAQWVNRYGDRPEGDERVYARAVTDRLGVALTAIAKPLTPLKLPDLEELAGALRPMLNGADPARDRDMAARLGATGATGILSGQGGDAVFFQMPSPLIFAGRPARARPRSPGLARSGRGRAPLPDARLAGPARGVASPAWVAGPPLRIEQPAQR